jgi:F-type H+-transporting ATPase subunit b
MPSISIDSSFFIQIASFLILWFGLKRLLFDPMVRVLDEREARTTGSRRAAAAMRTAADVAAAEYERRIHEVRVALAADAEAARHATQDAERQIVTAARDEASHQLTQLRETLRRQAEAARPAVATEARELSARILERALGRSTT